MWERKPTCVHVAHKKPVIMKDKIQQSIHFIEERLTEPLTVDGLAGQLFFSKTHFQRLFHQIVGEPVMEYVKKRRLQQACAALCETNATVLDIALRFGYSSHEGFTRAFKGCYGISPSRYRRKNTNSLLKEEISMIPTEIMQKMDKYIAVITRELNDLSDYGVTMAGNWEKEAKAIGNEGKTALILIMELQNFAQKVKRVAGEVKDITENNPTVYELSEKIYNPMKMLDDIAFQMNLLRFFGGIEIARMGEAHEKFMEFDRELEKHCDRTRFTKTSISLLQELGTLLKKEIKREALTQINAAITELRKVAAEGEALGNKTEGIPFGVFPRFGRMVKDRTTKLQKVTEMLEGITDDIERADTNHPFAMDNIAMNTAIKGIGDLAFDMNINAFNAAIEAARSGEPVLGKCAEQIRDYAWALQQTHMKTNDHFTECERLIKLAFAKEVRLDDADLLKYLEDIQFQGSILASQFTLEAERAGKVYDGFIPIAKQAEDAVIGLTMDMESLTEYAKKIIAITGDLNNEIQKAGVYAPPFAYIAREYGYYIGRMKTF
jgi:AraC family transcriptional regulator